MSLWSIFKRKKWEKLGEPISVESLYTEMWRLGCTGAYLRDGGTYRSIPNDDFMEIVRDYSLPFPKYKKDIYDCDDFTTCLRADVLRAWAELSNGSEPLAFGWVDGKIDTINHAWIWQRDDKGKYWWIEPQTLGLLKGIPKSIHIFEG